MSSSGARNEANEIDLIELIVALWQQKMLIILMALSVFAVSALYAFTEKPVYESSMTLEPATLVDIGPAARKVNKQSPDDEVISLKQARSLLKEAFQIFTERLSSPSVESDFRAVNANHKAVQGFTLRTASSNWGAGPAFTVTITAPDPSLAKSTLEAYVVFVGARALAEVNDFYKVSYSGSSDALSNIYRVQSEAQFNAVAVRPKKALILALGVVLGGVLGVGVAMVLIHLKKSRGCTTCRVE